MSHPRKFDIDAIILDLSKIETLLKSNPHEKAIFLRDFSTWADHRKETISQLGILKTELDDICRKANIGRCIGTGLSVVGALASLVGFGLSLSSDEKTSSTGKDIAKCGIGAGAIGGVTSFVSSAAECGINQRILSKVKSSLVKDQQLTKDLIPYLVKSENLNSLFEKVFGCDILSDTKDDILAVINGMITLCDKGKNTFAEISMAFSSSINECTKSYELKRICEIFQRLSKKVQFILLQFCENPKVRKAVWEIVEAIKRSPIALDFFKICLKIKNNVSCVNLGSLLPQDLAHLFEKLMAAAAHAFEKLIIFVTDIINFIATAEDIVNSESKYSGIVENILTFLSRELNESSRLVSQFRK